MATIQVNFSAGTMAIIEEIMSAIEHQDGYRPSRSQIIRMAVAALRRSFVESGKLAPPVEQEART